MKKIIPLILATIVLAGCSKSKVNASWNISANPLGNDEYELKAGKGEKGSGKGSISSTKK